jgi:hypothetical protein
MEKGIYTEGFFNLREENLYKSQVARDIDNNKAQLLKTDAKFYAIHVSPSAKELQTMGSTEQEQAEDMRKYIREVFIPEYAKNFNKGISAEEIKFYGKIHFDRNRSDNELNMHCHLIVSRKDQSNKKKLSPLTNHRDTKKGAIKGGFDRTKLFQSVELGFDKLFNYDRPLVETFEYCNVMKNGSIAEQINLQKKMLTDETTFDRAERSQKEKEQVGLYADVQIGKDKSMHADMNISSPPNLGKTSTLGVFSPEIHGEDMEELRKAEEIKREKRNQGITRR